MEKDHLSFYAVEVESLVLHGRRKLKQILFHPSTEKVGYFTYPILFKMDSGEGVEAQVPEYQNFEEVFEDKDSEVFDTLLSFGSFNQLNSKLKILKD